MLGASQAGFFNVEKETDPDLVYEARERIGELYDIETKIRSRTADERLAVRQEHSRPQVEAFKALAEEQLEHISGKPRTWTPIKTSPFFDFHDSIRVV